MNLIFKMIIFVLLSLIVLSDGARILAMFPTPSISHQVVYRPLMLELAKNHEVVIITPDVVSDPPANYTQIDVHDISYSYWTKNVISAIDGSGDPWKFIDRCVEAVLEIFALQINSEQVKELLHSGQRFDLVFVEAFIAPAYALAYHFQTPLIIFSSMSFSYPIAPMIGAASHPLLFPELSRKRLFNLSLYEKICALYEEFSFRLLALKQITRCDEIVKNFFGSNCPLIQELVDKADMLFLGVNQMWDSNRPVPPGVVYTGALHVKPSKELPTDLQSYLDNSIHGVIYMSFGTNVDPTLLSPERIKVFCKVFSKLPYDVLWKWNGDELPGKPDNVRIFKWLPQSDLLKHPKVKLFITQGGLQSTDEAIIAGVPLIAFPMLADQWYNAEKYEHFGIGKQMEFESVTEEILQNAIKTVIEDQMYKESITRLGVLMRDQPLKPLEKAVWWTEHVLRHRGASHLRSPMANIAWADYLILDVVLVLLGSALLAAFVLSFIFIKFYKIVVQILSPYSKLKHA